MTADDRTVTEAGGFTFREVDRDTWADFERLFSSRGGPKSCWCMVWRATAEEARQTDGASRKAAIHRRVAADIPIGILAYRHGEPVGWCSIAPRETYRAGLGGEDPAGEAAGRVWSIACFYTARTVRGQGLQRALIEVAIDRAAAHGAEVVEAYPVDPESPSYRFMGFVETFRALGFTEVGTVGSRRYRMRRPVT